MPEDIIETEPIIHVMPDTLANKIAAGEVVQRPASAAKELIENAIDAGADQVTLLLKAAGRELIQVIDNGCGMGPKDAVACFLRHATSKIRSIDDLERIRTLGFRGEALASIAAVSQVELRTKRHADEAGFCVRIDGGVIAATTPCATPNGTSFAIRNLFYNVPARRNFLKTPATEFKHLVETFQFLALANPRVGFVLIHDDNEVYRLVPATEADPHLALRHRIMELLGDDHGEHLVPVEEVTSYLSVRGWVGRPDFNRRSRGEQFLFVNNRYVKNRYLEHAVQSAYGDTLPEGSYAFFTLFMDLDPRHVDVNVHPTKAEVKFDDERGVYGFIRAVVKKALGSANLTPQLEASPSADGGRGATDGLAGLSMPQATPFTPVRRDAARTTEAGGRIVEAGRSFEAGRGAAGAANQVYAEGQGRSVRAAASGFGADLGARSDQLYAPPPRTNEVVASEATPDPDADDEARTTEGLLWQLHDKYILTQIRSGLMIIDQNAAHERVLFERAFQCLQGGMGLSQQLLFPHTLDFSPADHELLKELVPDLRALGFDVEFFSGRSVVVRGVPADVRAGDERTILEEILEQYKNYRDTLQIKGRENLAKSIARRSAIASGTRLSVKEMRSLIDKLFLCEMPYACPNGRPTMVKISIEELDKRFGR